MPSRTMDSLLVRSESGATGGCGPATSLAQSPATSVAHSLVQQTPRQPAADLDAVDPSGRVTPGRQRPVAGRRVVERAEARQQPYLAADRLQQLHLARAEEARECAVED